MGISPSASPCADCTIVTRFGSRPKAAPTIEEQLCPVVARYDGGGQLRNYDPAGMYYSAAALLIGLVLAIWLKSWRLVVALVLGGIAVSIIGWQANWFGDVATGGDFTAGGGALVFWLFVCLPLAVGAGLGVYVARSSDRRRRDEDSTLPVIAPPGNQRRR